MKRIKFYYAFSIQVIIIHPDFDIETARMNYFLYFFKRIFNKKINYNKVIQIKQQQQEETMKGVEFKWEILLNKIR